VSQSFLRVAALAGGVGGARLIYGLANSLPAGNLNVIVNIGDDFEHLGLKVCPDLDTVCYTLAGLENPKTGWGLLGETWNALESLEKLGGPAWFRIGDRDLGTHLERTRRLRNGQSLSQVTRRFCQAWGIGITILPASDDNVPTWVYTEEGDMPFQEYFVHHQCHPIVKGFCFEGCDQASPAPGVVVAMQEADLIVICPSNPWVSIDPILAIPGIRQMLESRPVLAVSPIIGGKAVKGPAAKMYSELGIEPSAASVAGHYQGFLNGFVFDEVDRDQLDIIGKAGLQLHITDTLMRDQAGRNRLAGEVLRFGEQLAV
jgi:LPPG:FO 2-phospho-L-lactate transferase